MAKYVALQEIWSSELQEYFHPGDVFEVQDDSAFAQLVDAGVLTPLKSNQEVQFKDAFTKEWVTDYTRDPAIPYQVQVVNRSKVKPQEVSDGANN